MGGCKTEKTTIMVLKLKVDLQCSSSYKKVKKILCKFPQIRDQVYDEKANTVTITVVCCNPEKIRDKLCCKGCGVFISIEIIVPKSRTPPSTPPSTPPPSPPPPLQLTLNLPLVLMPIQVYPPPPPGCRCGQCDPPLQPGCRCGQCDPPPPPGCCCGQCDPPLPPGCHCGRCDPPPPPGCRCGQCGGRGCCVSRCDWY
ncbi:protein PYRICULARIA ORYZAE RESISTANCE 21-like isoform X1 [Lycium ferocissimum]|uniref:protein PYRICULARIA ORYZAE RESISTANCE 21-like isoform X1 n=1 Tax=Lycium ferocissimum TaxID=112874 RepID=UPI00281616CB|nr:protein PYRICULARIA ORYZAE RESISTANCE 21-like isoform X1 [Lycium ferocissimum]